MLLRRGSVGTLGFKMSKGATLEASLWWVRSTASSAYATRRRCSTTNHSRTNTSTTTNTSATTIAIPIAICNKSTHKFFYRELT